MHFGARF